jgi:hypothetical protein
LVDFCVMGKGNPKQFDAMVKRCADMRMATEVFPITFAKQGTGFKGQGRISAKKQLGVDYVLAPSLLCEALINVEAERKAFVNDLKAYEWECITFVPMEVEEEFGHSKDIMNIARDIRSWFNPKVVAAMSLNDKKMQRASYNAILNGHFHICTLSGEKACPVNCPDKNKLMEEGLKQMMEGYDYETRLFIAVEMKRLVHHNAMPKMNEDGSMRGVADGVFANNIMYNYYLEALDKAGLTGKYVPVELDRVSDNLRIRDAVIDVTVENGNVIRKSDDFWIGTVDADNGDFKMVNGMLELRAPSEEITSRRTFADAIGEDGEMAHAAELEANN